MKRNITVEGKETVHFLKGIFFFTPKVSEGKKAVIEEDAPIVDIDVKREAPLKELLFLYLHTFPWRIV